MQCTCGGDDHPTETYHEAQPLPACDQLAEDWHGQHCDRKRQHVGDQRDESCRHALVDSDGDRVLTSLTTAPIGGKVRLGIPEEYAGKFLAELLPLFTMQHPAIELEVEAASSEALTAMMKKQRLDAALTVVGEHDSPADGAVAKVRLVWVAGTDTRALSGPVLPVALHAAGCPYRDAAIAALKGDGRPWRAVLTSSNSAAIATAVKSGMAVALMDGSRLPEGVAAVPERYGLPALPVFRIVYRSHGNENAELCLRAAIMRFFGSDS